MNMVLRAQARARAISRASPAGTSAGGGAASRRRLCRECCDGMRSRFTSGTTGNTFFCVENVGTLGGRRFDSSPRRTNTKVRGLPVQEFDTFDASAFSVITNLVTPFWLLMVLAPNWTVTEKTMKSEWPIIICALVQLAVVLNGLTAEPIADVAERLQFFATEAVIKLSAMGKMRAYDSFVSEEWAHVLVWDLFAGRYVYLDGREKNVPVKHSIVLCFALGPVGILSHYGTRKVVEKLEERRINQ